MPPAILVYTTLVLLSSPLLENARVQSADVQDSRHLLETLETLSKALENLQDKITAQTSLLNNFVTQEALEALLFNNLASKSEMQTQRTSLKNLEAKAETYENSLKHLEAKLDTQTAFLNKLMTKDEKAQAHTLSCLETNETTGMAGEDTHVKPVHLNITFKKDATIATVHSHSKVVVCYLGSWAFYRNGSGKYDVLDKFNPDLCTHLIYSFAVLDNKTNEMKAFDPFLDLEKDDGQGWYKKVAAIKQSHPHLSVLLAIGGWNEGSEKYSKMVTEVESRRTFTQSVLAIIREHGFNGLDLDWEYPTQREGKPEDRENFVKLVEELRAEFDKFGLMLTAAFGASKEICDVAYDLPVLSRLLDHIHIMTYDYHGSWAGSTGHNSPLYAPPGNLSVASTVDYFISRGVDPEKLVLGLPLYGRTFLLKSPHELIGSGLNKPTEAQGFQGPHTAEYGYMAYNEICTELAANRGYWKTYWDTRAKVPFMRSGAKWVTFENTQSLYQKVEFALSKGLRGAMVWAVDLDDFHGTCGSKYPLLQSINYALTVGDNSVRIQPPMMDLSLT